MKYKTAKPQVIPSDNGTEHISETLKNWEQGRARPNAQAATLIRLVERYPDTVERLAMI